MKTVYTHALKAHVTSDAQERVRHVLHTHGYFRSEMGTAREAAADYLRQMAETLQIPPGELQRLHQPSDFLDPREQGVEYRYYETKKFFASSTFCYYQTIHNTPVWHGGLTVTVKPNPYRVVRTTSYGHPDLSLDLPSRERIDAVRNGLRLANAQPRTRDRAAGRTAKRDDAPSMLAFTRLEGATEVDDRQAPAWFGEASVVRGYFYVYRYDEKERQPEHAVIFGAPLERKEHEEHVHLTLPLPQVPGEIRHGQYYLVAELVFHLRRKPWLHWKALVEVRTGAILRLRAMVAGVNGLVFTYDPKTSTGVLTNHPESSNATLDPLRDDVTLLNLVAPEDGTQSLTGTHVTLMDDDAPDIDPPTKPTGSNFEYQARTNDFAGVNAYYHSNGFFDRVESLGFDLYTYFDGTAFPVHVDHRASHQTPDGVEINAFCSGDGASPDPSDGIGLVGFCLSETTSDSTVSPMGRAVDKWVHWHELGGHGIQWDHVNDSAYGFAHSTGDVMAAFQNDPVSELRLVDERYRYAPFLNISEDRKRWFNRKVADGWGWGGSKDDGGDSYDSEQILSTTLFRMYQSLGGDAEQVNKRWHASRVSTYLVLNAVGKLSPGTNPAEPVGFHDALIDSDADDWTSTGYAGGAYNKVIRWAFEKQDLWSGDPPAVDLYVDDGRGGEYTYQAVHWNNQSVWNRVDDDGQSGHEDGAAGVTSYAYVRVKNRGTSSGSGTVKVYHCNPGAGLTWPTDFVQAGPADGLPTGNIAAGNATGVVVGPFAWTPNVNAYGHDCLLAIVTADGDPSNVDNLEPGQTIQEWRLVPHDNNVGQRNVVLVPGGGGGEMMSQAMDGAWFFAGNNFNHRATFELRVEVPRFLVARGWGLDLLPDQRFTLKPGEKRRIELRLRPGADFTAKEVREADDRDFRVSLFGEGMLVGGMTYTVDPDRTGSPPRAASSASRHSLWDLLGRLVRALRRLLGGR
jgi:hypothetical protein